MPKELSYKADLALSDLSTNGGLLAVDQADKFIEQLIDTPTLLNEARVYPMNNPSQEINKTKFGSRILQAAEDASGDRAIHSGSRALTAAKRSKPDTSKVTLNTKEYIAEIRLPYETLEDNIERQGFENTVMRMITGRVATDIEEMLIQGDTASGDSYLALQDGLLELITSNTVDAASAAMNAQIFTNTFKAMPTQYRRNINDMRFYAHPNVVADYRLALASRQTGLGDAVITGNADPLVMGVPLRAAALMPQANMVFTDPKNLLVGMQRNIRIETDKDIQTREVIIVVTLRAAIQMEEEEAAVKVANVGTI